MSDKRPPPPPPRGQRRDLTGRLERRDAKREEHTTKGKKARCSHHQDYLRIRQNEEGAKQQFCVNCGEFV